MEHGMATNDAHEWFDVYRDLTKTKDHQAEVTAGHSFHRESGAHVEWRERHRGV
jgi:hypothetical protein